MRVHSEHIIALPSYTSRLHGQNCACTLAKIESALSARQPTDACRLLQRQHDAVLWLPVCFVLVNRHTRREQRMSREHISALRRDTNKRWDRRESSIAHHRSRLAAASTHSSPHTRNPRTDECSPQRSERRSQHKHVQQRFPPSNGRARGREARRRSTTSE